METLKIDCLTCLLVGRKISTVSPTQDKKCIWWKIPLIEKDSKESERERQSSNITTTVVHLPFVLAISSESSSCGLGFWIVSSSVKNIELCQ